jgi:DNA-binding winged helix-turn-helix (wHTH) protein
VSGLRTRSRARIIELDERARVGLARRYHALQGCGDAVVITMTTDLRQPLLATLNRIVSSINFREERRVEELIDDLLPPVGAPTAASIERARQEAQLRFRILKDFGAHSGPDVAALGQSAASNRSQTAHRWRQQGRIFAVHHQGALLYLAFQFEHDGRPRPVIERVIERLGPMSDWDLAYWFVAGHRLLDGRLPVDVLAENEEAVVRAAAHDAQRQQVDFARGGHFAAQTDGARRLEPRRGAVGARRTIGPRMGKEPMAIGDLVVNATDRTVTLRGRMVALTPKEFDLLVVLARRRGAVLSYQYLLYHVWGPEAVGHTERLRVHVNHLRHKLRDDPQRPRLVTERRVGYRLVARPVSG